MKGHIVKQLHTLPNKIQLIELIENLDLLGCQDVFL
jgi:hypothetical protein